MIWAYRHRTAVALAALALTGATACGGGHGSARPVAPVAAPTAVPAGSLPCTARSGVALPGGWPSAIPLPTGLVVTRTERRSGGRLIAYGRVRGDFHAEVRSFNTRLPAAGFAQRKGQIDPHDAESNFVGRTVRGRWTAGLSPECGGQSSVTVLVLPAGNAGGSDG